MKTRFLFPFVIASALLIFSASGNPVDAEKECIVRLSDTSQAERDDAATQLRRMIRRNKVTYGEGHLRTHDSAYWYSKIASVNRKGTVAEVIHALGLDSSQSEIGMCSGQTCFNTYRLDNSMVLQLHYLSNEPHRVFYDTIMYAPKRMEVEAPPHFSGTWITYFVNGQRSHAIEYTDGMYSGNFIAYHDNGLVSYRQHYTASVANGSDSGFYYSGRLLYAGNYRNGKQEGEWVHYFESGKVKSRRTYIDGELHGKETTYYEFGTVFQETWYDHGKQTRHRTLDTKGNVQFDTNTMK